jgi:putative ABC transport system permease protein
MSNQYSVRLPASWRVISLARLGLIRDTRRFWTAVLAVAFSGLLFLVQAGLLLGIFGTISVVVDHSSAHLWVTSSNTPSFDLGRMFPLRHEMTLRMHPDVMDVEPMLVGMASWRGSNNRQIMITVIGMEIRPNSLGVPGVFSPEIKNSLAEPNAVVVDQVDVDKLQAAVGGVAEINDKAVHVVGITSDHRAIGGAYVFTSIETARRLMKLPSDETTYLLASIRDPAQVEAVRDTLWRAGDKSPYRVWSAEDFSISSQAYWLLESGAGASFGFSSLLGFLVGLVVTAQTLQAAVHASLREYATLRALGVSTGALGRIVLEQSFWIGVMGMMAAAIGAVLVWRLAELLYVSIRFPWWSVAGAAVLMLVVACGSGLLALRTLFNAEPAELLR